MDEGHRTPQQLNIPDFERLRVTIKGSKPPISRDILIPENATFEDLHLTLQVAFGWKDRHLHQFEAGFVVGPTALNDGPVSEAKALDERLTWLSDLPPGETVSYEYDLGDSWEHIVERLGKVQANGREPRPLVTDGTGACPDEDSGGIRNWNDLARRSPGVGVAFDKEEVNERLARVGFDICGTWREQFHRRSSVRVVAPFLTDRSNAVHEASMDMGGHRGP